MNRRLLLALAWLALAPACSNPGGPDARQIYGSWDWLRSCGGIAGHCETPATAGYTERFVFETPGGYRRYRNDVVIERGTFAVSLTPDSSLFEVSFNSGARVQTAEFPGAGLLTLHDGCCDRFDHEFMRTER